MARTVEPKRKKVAESEKNLRLAQKELARIKVSIHVFCQPFLLSHETLKTKLSDEQNHFDALPSHACHYITNLRVICRQCWYVTQTWCSQLGHVAAGRGGLAEHTAAATA